MTGRASGSPPQSVPLLTTLWQNTLSTTVYTSNGRLKTCFLLIFGGIPIAGDLSIAGEFFDESPNPPLWDNLPKSEKFPRYRQIPRYGHWFEKIASLFKEKNEVLFFYISIELWKNWKQTFFNYKILILNFFFTVLSHKKKTFEPL